MSINLDELRAQIEILRWAKNQRATINELETQAKDAIQAAMGDTHDQGTLDGKPAIAWKRHKRTSINQRYLKQHHPEIAAECSDTSEVRRFEVHD